MFEWLRSERRARRNKIRLDRKHLEARARRFLKGYLNSAEVGKPPYYQSVEDISRKCQPVVSFGHDAPDDNQIAEATSNAAMIMAFQLTEALTEKDQPDFLTDACATVAIAYHRAAGVYIDDENMQELRTAAVHLLTMVTSYMSTHRDERTSDQRALPFEET